LLATEEEYDHQPTDFVAATIEALQSGHLWRAGEHHPSNRRSCFCLSRDSV